MAIMPSILSHKTLETDIAEYLDRKGFWVGAATYHEVLPDNIKRRLSAIYTPTALYLRGRADRIAVHKTGDVVIEWEAKTHTSGQRHDMTLEALPLCHHMDNANLGVICLYVYRDTDCGYECGFWTEQLNTRDVPVRVIMIPGRWNADQRAWYRKQFARVLPGVQIVDTGRNAGTGDPFLIIDESVVRGLPDWRCLIDELCTG